MSLRYTNEQINFLVGMKKKGATIDEIVEAYNEKFEEQKTWNAIRLACHKFANFDVCDDGIVRNLREVINTRVRNSKLYQENKKLVEYIEAQSEFLDEFGAILKKNPIIIHKPVKLKVPKKTKRTIVMHLSDTHFQSIIESDEMGGMNSYTEVEEARRLALITSLVAKYKLHYRNETELVIVCNGDLGQGIIHNQESTKPMTTQFSAMMHLLSQSISYLATQFKKVKVVCTVGNHLRFMHKSDKGRVSKQKWDSFATILHVSLQYALKTHKNVEFEIPLTPYAYTEILGHKFLIAHGDTFISTGTVGKTIAIDNIKNQLNDMQGALGKIDVAMLGHVHTALYQMLANGMELVINGSMSGADHFSQSLGYIKSISVQQFFEVTEEFAIGDMRFVKLNDADKQEDLDKIIQPFQGKF